MNEEMYEAYRSIPELKQYIDRYCKNRGKGLYEVFRDKIILEVADYYKSKQKDRIEPQGQQAAR